MKAVGQCQAPINDNQHYVSRTRSSLHCLISTMLARHVRGTPWPSKPLLSIIPLDPPGIQSSLFSVLCSFLQNVSPALPGNSCPNIPLHSPFFNFPTPRNL